MSIGGIKELADIYSNVTCAEGRIN